MTYTEHAFSFDCAGDVLVGVAAMPAIPSTATGVLVIVGGPQYRVGSHRQFVLLSRVLAARGIPCMRFDYRGMGDASGTAHDYQSIEPDIRAAVDAFATHVPAARNVVLWGLCDGASAACFYAARDPRVAGLVLLNPWVRSEVTAAKVYVGKYYLSRVLSLQFWKKLLGGGVPLRRASLEFLATLRRARSAASAATTATDLPTRMANGVLEAKRPVLLILSGRDFVANEFDQVAAHHPQWTQLLRGATAIRLDDADHTFSSAEWRDRVADATADWLSHVVREGGASARLHRGAGTSPGIAEP